jgi:hypothetical protein
MRRGIWFGAGVAAGVYGVVRVQRVVEAFSPDGIRDRIKAAGMGAKLLRDEVAQGQADAEPELRERYGVPAPTDRAIPELNQKGTTR